jgi:hypothetical protein
MILLDVHNWSYLMLNCFYSLSSYPTKIQSISITKTLFDLSTHFSENSLSQLLWPIINVYKSTVCPILTIQTHKSAIWAKCPASMLTLCRSNLNPYCLGRKAAFFQPSATDIPTWISMTYFDAYAWIMFINVQIAY